MASRVHRPVIPRLDAMEQERPPPALVSELLEEIFLRVASPTDLARASAACVSFRRLISNPAFLRRYRSVHPPLVLGFLNTAGFHPVEATHPSAAIARAVARTADFSFDFLPLRKWQLYDVRDGRVLVGCMRMNIKKDRMDIPEQYVSWDIAVCDPLARQYLMLPPFTDDLLASVDLHNQDMSYYSEVSLVPSKGMEDETSFSVICRMISRSEPRLAVFIFSTSSGHWAAGTSINWADLGLYGEVSLTSGQCVYGYFYWKVRGRNKLFKLDMNTMELCTYDLPPDHEHRNVVVVEVGEGKVAMFSAFYQCTSLEYYTLLQNGTEKSHKWHLKSTIPLPVHGTSTFVITGQAEGYVFLRHMIQCLEFFSLEVKSCNIERACRVGTTFNGFLYCGFPPSMSPRRIQEYGED